MLFKPLAHFVIVNQLSTVSLGYALTYSGTEAGAFFNQAQRCLLDYLLSTSSGVSGDFSKLCFLLR